MEEITAEKAQEMYELCVALRDFTKAIEEDEIENPRPKPTKPKRE